MIADYINATFEICGAGLQWVSAYRVWTDRGYAGVYLPAAVLFTAWGYWNLWYYPSLGQWWSAAATVAMVLANSVWIILMLAYGRIRRDR